MKTRAKRKRRSVGGGRLYLPLVAAFLAAALVVRVADPFFVRGIRLIAFDTLQQLAPAKYDPALPVKIVDIDEDSLGRIGQWPWSRTVVADLARRLAEDGAAVIAFDVLFSEADKSSPEEIAKSLPEKLAAALAEFAAGEKSHDAVLAAAVAEMPTVLAAALTNRPGTPPPAKAGIAIAGDDPRPEIIAFSGATTNLPALDEAAAGIGSINWVPDRDQVIRRLPLIFRVGDNLVPTLVMEALRVAQGASTYVLKASNASGETAFGRTTGLNHIRIGDLEIPTDADGGIWLRFRTSEPAKYIPAWKVLAKTEDAGDIAGRIILVGTSAPGLADLRATPLDAAIPGVEVHAQGIEHILAGRSLTRPDYALALELTLMIALGFLLARALLRLSAQASAIMATAVIGSLVLGAWLAFDLGGLLFDPSYPAAALAFLSAGIIVQVYRRAERQRSEVRRAFSHYVAPTVVDEIIADPDRLELGGEIRDLTLMFCDVREFTSISETMSATELTLFLNGLLTPLSGVILEHRGTIDKYMGDGIMAFWNAPLDDPDHAKHACTAAVDMLTGMKAFNDARRREAEAAGRSFRAVRIGIGINTGACCVGNLGSVQRFDYSAIGDEVNVASRLEGLTKAYGVDIVIGEATRIRCPEVKALEIDLVRVKGREQPTQIYTILPADEATGDVGGIAPAHAEFLIAYRQRDWDRAISMMATCRSLGAASLERCYDIFATRIEGFRREPPPEEWDGAFLALSK